MGRERYPDTDRLMITADGGGSNGSRVRLFKVELQKLADETGLTLQICHYPPGTSKWNKIEHRLFCHITQTWRGKPLTSRLAVVELIGATTTDLRVRCELDTRAYPKRIKVTDAEMAALNIKGDTFHPEWNYTISPTAPPRSTCCWASPKRPPVEAPRASHRAAIAARGARRSQPGEARRTCRRA